MHVDSSYLGVMGSYKRVEIKDIKEREGQTRDWLGHLPVRKRVVFVLISCQMMMMTIC